MSKLTESHGLVSSGGRVLLSAVNLVMQTGAFALACSRVPGALAVGAPLLYSATVQRRGNHTAWGTRSPFKTATHLDATTTHAPVGEAVANAVDDAIASEREATQVSVCQKHEGRSDNPINRTV